LVPAALELTGVAKQGRRAGRRVRSVARMRGASGGGGAGPSDAWGTAGQTVGEEKPAAAAACRGSGEVGGRRRVGGLFCKKKKFRGLRVN